MRELEEETGLKVAISDILDLGLQGVRGLGKGGAEGISLEILRSGRYSVNPYKNIGKETRFWVGIVRGEQEVILQTEEVDEFRWCGWEEARVALRLRIRGGF